MEVLSSFTSHDWHLRTAAIQPIAKPPTLSSSFSAFHAEICWFETLSFVDSLDAASSVHPLHSYRRWDLFGRKHAAQLQLSA